MNEGFVCLCVRELHTQTKTSFPVDVERLSAYLSINPETEQGQAILSFGSTAAIHGKGRIRFLALKSLSSNFFNSVFHSFLLYEAMNWPENLKKI